MLDLFILMMERVGLIILLAFLLVNVTYFKRVLENRTQLSSKVILIIVFGLFAILTNFTGIEITGNQIVPSNFLTHISENTSIANARTLVISVAGLVGGPSVGTTVGGIAGVHRFLQGSGEGSFYIFSSLLIGLISGLVRLLLIKRQWQNKALIYALVGILMESIQMIFVAFFSGTDLAKMIAGPMIMINGIGTFIFMSIINVTLKQEEQAKAVQAHDVLNLAAQTLPYFRAGLKRESSQAVAEIIQRYTKLAAISMTDKHQILAHVGAGSDHHIPELEVITELSKKVLQTGEMLIAHSKEQIGCKNPDCPLAAAIVIPLFAHEQVVGTLKMYFTDESKLTYVEEELAEGLATIFSSQIELGEAEERSRLLKDAEIKSLQAQVNPHFFFNAINTISALMRRDTDQARSLLLQLSNYFRGNLTGARQTKILLSQELQHLAAYLQLEQARFPNRYQIDVKTSDALENALIPPYAVQILVENAIKHAFANRKEDNYVEVRIFSNNDALILQVEDNGVGIKADLLPKLGKQAVVSAKGTGTALENLNRRLHSLYGETGELKAENKKTGGAIFTITLPLELKGGEE